MALLSFSHNFSIPFLRYKKWTFFVLIVIFLATIFNYWKMGLNWGIDFKGGIAIEAQMAKEPILDQLRPAVQKNFPGQEVSIQQVGPKDSHTLLLRTEKKGETEDLLASLRNVLGQDVVFRKVDTVGPKLGQELLINSIWAVAWTLLVIMVYV